jgi:hypothetical protein
MCFGSSCVCPLSSVQDAKWAQKGAITLMLMCKTILSSCMLSAAMCIAAQGFAALLGV